MTLNKTSIEWTDFSWNPVTGCRKKCEWCYASAMARRFHRSFEPEFHPERLHDLKNLKAGDKVFVCSMADLFGEWVPRDWIVQVLNLIRQYPHSIFQLLTKNSQRYSEFAPLPDNCWAGVTVTMEMGAVNAFPSRKRIAKVQWISAEPLFNRVHIPCLGTIDWVVMGAMTGPLAAKHRPEPEWVKAMVQCCKHWEIRVFQKNSIAPYWAGDLIKEFPT